MQIITSLSAWWLLPCLLAGLAYAWLLYRDTRSVFTPALTRLLAAARAVIVFLLCVLLLSPVIRSTSKDSQRPILVIAEDNSESVLSPDSSILKNAVRPSLSEAEKTLADKYEIHRISFSDVVKDGAAESYSGQQTDFTGLVSELNTRFVNRNVGAVIIATDGIYNKGGNPLYTPLAFKAPVHTIALGDTAVRKDVLIASVNHNKVVYLGNSFPLEVSIDARQCAGSQLQLTVRDDSVTLFSRTLSVGGGRFRSKIPVVLDAKKQGVMRLKVSVSTVPGEISTLNNQRDVFIEVKASKENVLLLGNAPHPDLGAMKEILESTGNYEVKVALASSFDGKPGNNQLVVLHNLPSRENQLEAFFTGMRAAGIPGLFVLGAQTDPGPFTRLDMGLSLQTSNPGKTNAVTPSLAPSFSLFNIDRTLTDRLVKFPPVSAPFGDYRLSGPASVLFYQRIGAVISQEPLLVFMQNDRNKSAFLCGEGFWRWPLMENAEFGDAAASREILLKTVQFLSVKDDRSRFRIRIRNSFNENEPVVVDAELYNDNYEMVNTPEVSFEIFDSQGKKFPFNFTRTERAYLLEAGFLPPGVYRYVASTSLGDRKERVAGEFSVAEVRAEQAETVADHGLLAAWAKNTGGTSVLPSQIDRLVSLLAGDENVKSVSYSRVTMRDLVDLPWFFFLLLVLLSGEWLIRKRSGSY